MEHDMIEEYKEAFEVWIEGGATGIELIDALGIKPTIGQLVGIVSHSFKITNTANVQKQLSIKIDYRTSSDPECRGWLAGTSTISGQRPWRALSVGDLDKLVNNKTFNAQSIGSKIKSFEEIKQGAMTVFDNMTPEQQKAYIAELNAKAGIESDDDEDETE